MAVVVAPSFPAFHWSVPFSGLSTLKTLPVLILLHCDRFVCSVVNCCGFWGHLCSRVLELPIHPDIQCRRKWCSYPSMNPWNTTPLPKTRLVNLGLPPNPLTTTHQWCRSYSRCFLKLHYQRTSLNAWMSMRQWWNPLIPTSQSDSELWTSNLLPSLDLGALDLPIQ